jgi:acyl-CoA synthetase (NDP forming)
MDNLNRLLRPKSIAVIGGGSWCENVLEQCEKIGFKGEVWPVHPEKKEIAGYPTFPSVNALPSPPDASFIGVNRTSTVDIVGQLSSLGAGGAVCFASGFQEAQNESANGSELQTELVKAAGTMKIIGPNCYGLVNYLDGAALWPDQHGGVRCKTGVALITQSSNIAINLTMQKRGLPVAYVVSVGNQAQTDLSEIGMAMLDDPRVTTLGLHIEGIHDLRGFEALAARAEALKKSIVVLKIGASDQAQAATISHTASLAGSDAGASALIKRLGMGRVDSLSTLMETLKLLHVAGPLRSSAIASMSCSGGEASLFADSVAGTSVTFPVLNTQQYTQLREALGPMVALANPLDYHTYIWSDLEAMTNTFSAMMEPELGLGCIVVDFPRSDRCSAADWDIVIEAADRAHKARNVPIALVGSLPENMPEDIAIKVMDLGLVPLCGLAEAIQAIEVAANFSKRSHDPILLPRKFSEATTLSELEAKTKLSKFGIEIPASVRAGSIDEIGIALKDFTFPVVLKGEGVVHKSDEGAVALNLPDARAVKDAAKSMSSNSFMIEEMVEGGICELLVGVVCDPAHGYVLTMAAGGVLTEILQDRVCVMLPATREEVECELSSLKIANLLKGYRGAKSADFDAILDAIMALQEFVKINPVIEAEINPLICTPDRAIACDALIKIGHAP